MYIKYVDNHNAIRCDGGKKTASWTVECMDHPQVGNHNLHIFPACI